MRVSLEHPRDSDGSLRGARHHREDREKVEIPAARLEGPGVQIERWRSVEPIRDVDGRRHRWRTCGGDIGRCSLLLPVLLDRAATEGQEVPGQHDWRVPQGAYQSWIRCEG